MRPSTPEAGFTLVEAVVALGISALLIAGLTATFAILMKSRANTRERSVALEAARAKLEEVVALPFLTVVAFDGQSFAAGVGPRALPAQPGDSDGLPGKVAVTSPSLLMRRVTVSVAWRGVNGNQSIEASTLITNRLP